MIDLILNIALVIMLAPFVICAVLFVLSLALPLLLWPFYLFEKPDPNPRKVKRMLKYGSEF